MADRRQHAGKKQPEGILARLELDTNLDAVAGGDNLRVVVFKLVTWAESGGRIQALVAGAQSQQPGNPDVRRLVQAARSWDALQPASTPPGAAPHPSTAAAPAEIDIFLSYSHLDDALMRPLYAALRAAGFSVWIDDGLEPGTPSWQVAIQEAIRQARCLVLLMTPNANASTWVNNEVHYATALGKRIFPVHGAGSETEAVPPPLFGAQRVDARRNYAQAVAQKLLPALQRHLHPDDPVAASAPVEGAGRSPARVTATQTPPSPAPKPAPVASERTPVIFDWVTIPAGEFLMGSDKQKDPDAF
ncbi:MAG: toll/interleukin-1 receptor domain-containing protein, partial [Caldilinea sp.]